MKPGPLCLGLSYIKFCKQEMHLKDIISDNNKISTASTTATLVAKIGLDLSDKILKLQNDALSELLFRKSPSIAIGLKLIVHSKVKIWAMGFI